MNPYRVLSVGWMALCIFNGLMALRECLLGWILADGKIDDFVLVNICAALIYALGGAANLFLYRGNFWARMVICGAAFFNAMAFGLMLYGDKFLSRSLIFLVVINILYSWVSIIVLLVPKKYWGMRVES